ncbi:MAG: DUF1643 domain-containing protein [Planctomycetota bacterium]|jgi:hypothetical protein
MPAATPRTITNPGLLPWQGSAEYSPCKRYRYTLTRVWDGSLPVCNFLMLNPSTATAEKNDPTVRRALGYAQRWAYGTLIVTNIFALRATNPKELYSCPDPVGKGNDKAILDAARKADLVVGAWGNHGELGSRGAHVVEMLTNAGIELLCLKTTGKGHPSHPLYL